MKIQVFLNHSDQCFRGFAPEYAPALHRACEFELGDNVEIVAHMGIPRSLLEWVFEQLNVGGDLVPAEPWTVDYRRAHHRSLSVGDVVVVGEMAFAVASSGWKRITTDDLLDAISRGGWAVTAQ